MKKLKKTKNKYDHAGIEPKKVYEKINEIVDWINDFDEQRRKAYNELSKIDIEEVLYDDERRERIK